MFENDCGALIKQIHCAMLKNANNDLRDADLTFAQVHLLFTLERHPDQRCSMKELERHMKVAQSTTAGLVKRCGEKGFVECICDPEDRRAKYVCLTEKGLDACENRKEHIRRSEAILTQDLTAEEKDTLITLLNKVCRSVSQPMK